MQIKASKQIAVFRPILQLKQTLMIVFLALALLPSVSAFAASDPELTDAIQKKDWPAVVLLLEPKQGQNFEQDLTLAKAQLSLERRIEALKLLGDLSLTRKDERVTKLYQSAGTMFFNQETATLYYEALELIHNLKFTDAKDRIEQALAKEPGQWMLLTRLVQMDLVLGHKDAAQSQLKLLQSLSLNSAEAKLFAAKLEVLLPLDSEEDNETTLYQNLLPLKAQLLENEVTLPLWAEGLKRAHKTSDLEALAQMTSKLHSQWSYAMMWFLENATLTTTTNQNLRAILTRNLKNKEAFTTALGSEMKASHDFWVGYVVYETLIAELKANEPTSTPTPSPSASP